MTDTARSFEEIDSDRKMMEEISNPDDEWEGPPPPKAAVPAALKELRGTDQLRHQMIGDLEEMLEETARFRTKLEGLLDRVKEG